MHRNNLLSGWKSQPIQTRNKAAYDSSKCQYRVGRYRMPNNPTIKGPLNAGL